MLYIYKIKHYNELFSHWNLIKNLETVLCLEMKKKSILDNYVIIAQII